MLHSLPNFLIIGAMKAGTTTLYEDLSRCSDIYMPPEKEPNDLVSDYVETQEGLRRYSAKFSAARGAKAIGEASTAYTKRPHYEGVAARAHRILGGDLRLVYMTRDPIRRIVSHYHHEVAAGRATAPLNVAVLEDPQYVAYSRYEYQLQPWRETFAAQQILVVEFERYLSHRSEVLGEVRSFLGLSGAYPQPEGHRNASAGKAAVREGTLLGRLVRSRAYQFGVKQALPQSARDRLKAALVKRAPTSVGELEPDVVRELERRITE